MAAVMIGLDPHKGSHTAVVIDQAELVLGQVRVRACAAQAERLLAWASAWPERTWAVEGAGGLGHLLAQQLVAAGERVLDVQPKLAARVRLLAAGDVNKNDPNDARSVAVAALRSTSCLPVRADDHTAVLKVWAKRHRDLSRARNQVVCRMHAVLCDLVPGGVSKRITAGQAARVLEAGRAARRRRGSPLDTGRAVPDRPAPHRHPAARRQEEAGRGGPGLRHDGDGDLRGRPRGGRRGARRRRRHLPLPQPGPLRRLQRHRAGRGVLGRPGRLPAVAAREPADEPRRPHGRGHPDPLPAQPRAAPTTTRR